LATVKSGKWCVTLEEVEVNLVPARTLEKARTALAGIPRVELEALELIDPASIDAFADRLLDSGRPLDILICSKYPEMFPPTSTVLC
jgi:hypothetical protein